MVIGDAECIKIMQYSIVRHQPSSMILFQALISFAACFVSWILILFSIVCFLVTSPRRLFLHVFALVFWSVGVLAGGQRK